MIYTTLDFGSKFESKKREKMKEINTVIIGTGISGLAMAKSCKDYGIDYLILGNEFCLANDRK